MRFATSAFQCPTIWAELDALIKIFTNLRLDMIDRMALQRNLDAIGQVHADPGEVEFFPGSPRR